MLAGCRSGSLACTGCAKGARTWSGAIAAARVSGDARVAVLRGFFVSRFSLFGSGLPLLTCVVCWRINAPSPLSTPPPAYLCIVHMHVVPFSREAGGPGSCGGAGAGVLVLVAYLPAVCCTHKSAVNFTKRKVGCAAVRLMLADPTGKAWPYGIQYAYLREVLATWRTSYDWRVQEAALNALPQFTVQIVRART